MRSVSGGALSLFGEVADVQVDRALTEFRGGRPLRITGGDQAIITLPVEGLTDQRLQDFQRLCAPIQPKLVVSETRAEALGLKASSAMAITLAAGADADAITRLVTEHDAQVAVAEPAGSSAAAAIELMKLSHGSAGSAESPSRRSVTKRCSR